MAEKILAWLNGRAVGEIIVTHKGCKCVLWSQREAIESGLTIEDAVARFIRSHGIDFESEVEGGSR